MGKRKTTRYPGVQARESDTRRFRGKPDICFTIDYRDASGKRIRKDVGWASQGFSAVLASEMRAKLIHAEKTGEILGAANKNKKQAPTFGEAWERYKQDWLEANGKKFKNHALVANQLAVLKDKQLSEITPYFLDKIMSEMRVSGKAPQTIRHAIGIVRAVMKRMAKWGLYDGPMPFDAITLPKLNNERERFLTPDEARRLLAEIRRRSVHTWLMALVSLHCGLRFGEVANLRWGQIRIAEMAIYIPESKSGKARHAVMTEEVKAALLELPGGVDSDLVFPARNGGVMCSISDSFFRAVDEIGLNSDGTGGKITDRRRKVVFHTLRHTYASWLAKSGQGQLVIADRLGHHSLEMTRRYTHLMDETRKASADAISRLFHADPPERQS